jgi:hypothetical protein
MVASVHFGWDFGRIGPFNSTFTDSGGADDIILSAGEYAHIDLSAGIGAGRFEAFADALTDALNASGTLSGAYSVGYDPDTNIINIDSDEAFAVSALNTNGQRILGASASSFMSDGSNRWESDVECFYSLVCYLEKRAHDSEIYEPSEGASDAVAGAESHYGICPADIEVWRDWTAAHELVANVFEADAAPARPWTWQHAFKHARNIMPFGFVDLASEGEVVDVTYHYLRAEGAMFGKQTRTMVSPDYRGRWDVKLMTRQMGTT